MATDYLVFTDDAIPILPIFDGLALGIGSATTKPLTAKGKVFNPALVKASGTVGGKSIKTIGSVSILEVFNGTQAKTVLMKSLTAKGRMTYRERITFSASSEIEVKPITAKGRASVDEITVMAGKQGGVILPKITGKGNAVIYGATMATGNAVSKPIAASGKARVISAILCNGSAQIGLNGTAKGNTIMLGLVAMSGSATISKPIAFGRMIYPNSQSSVIYRVVKVSRIPGVQYAKVSLEPVERPIDR